MTLALPVGKIQSIKSSAQKLSKNKRYHLNKTALKIHRLLHIGKICCLPSTSPLSITSFSKKLCFKGPPILPQSVQSKGLPEPRSHNRPKVVGRPLAVSQQNTNSYRQPRSHHHIGCLRSGLGSMVWGKSVQGLWSQEEMLWHINPRELQAAYFSLKIFSPSQINQLFHI